MPYHWVKINPDLNGDNYKAVFWNLDWFLRTDTTKKPFKLGSSLVLFSEASRSKKILLVHSNKCFDNFLGFLFFLYTPYRFYTSNIWKNCIELVVQSWKVIFRRLPNSKGFWLQIYHLKRSILISICLPIFYKSFIQTFMLQ